MENCRVDKLLSVLTTLNQDLHLKYNSNLTNGTLSSRMLRSHRYHRMAISKRMPFQVENEISFRFVDGHIVNKKQDEMCCNSICRYCRVCYHMLTCTCYTYAVSACICKHIHSAAQIATKTEVYHYNPNSFCPLNKQIKIEENILPNDDTICPPDVEFSDEQEDETAKLARTLEIFKESIQRIESGEGFDKTKANELIEKFTNKINRLFDKEPINKRTANQKRSDKKSKNELAMSILTKKFNDTQENFLDRKLILELFEENGIIESEGISILEYFENNANIIISDEKIYFL